MFARRILATSTLVFLLTGLGAFPASAHFLWITYEASSDPSKPATIHAFLSETSAPDLPEFKKYVRNARLTVRDRPVVLSEGEETWIASWSGAAPAVIDGECDLGVMTRGKENGPIRLFYTARAQTVPLKEDAEEKATGLRVALVKSDGGPAVARVWFNGKPAAKAEVKVLHNDGDVCELVTDDEGRLTVENLDQGNIALLVKWPDGQAGELDGKAFQETRHYATLTVFPATDAANPDATAKALATLPEPTNSFGAATLDGFLYVYGGHIDRTHYYHRGTTTNGFYRFNLKGGTAWETLPSPEGPGLQGVALVSDGRYLYRVGGMSAHNEKGMPQDLRSVADVLRFDPTTRTWTALTPMPEPRSTHDAVVADGFLYVVGGWTMPGGDSTAAEFVQTALRLKLDDPGNPWESLGEQPFRRRALAAASLEGSIYVIGGLNEDMEVERRVDRYDVATGVWSQVADLPGSKLEGFAPSAFAVQGRLYVVGRDGVMVRLSKDGSTWEAVGSLRTPRITHRLVPTGLNPAGLLVVGGTVNSRPCDSVELLPLPVEPSPATVAANPAD